MYAAASVSELLPAAADSARVVTRIYTVSLSALLPLAVAGVAAFALRRSQAAARAAVWRAAVIALLAVCVGGLFPVQRVAWIVPAGLASPIVALGRLQVGGPIAQLFGDSPTDGSAAAAVRLLLVVYLAGVAAVAIPLVAAAAKLGAQTRRATPIDDQRVRGLFLEASKAVGIRRDVRVLASDEVTVPLTWGVMHPVVLLPRAELDQPDDRLRAVFLHELHHVRSRDAGFVFASRLACAALWFHPAAWWISRRLRADCEMACDDRVLAMGIRQSDYAELLADACAHVRLARAQHLAPAICQREGLRERLRSILDPARDRRRASSLTAAVAVSLTMLATVPASLVQLAPTRAVLHSLMNDGRWESRAYAVLGLAQRPDSIEVARSAARTDPDPKVRAWARYAVSLEPVHSGAHRAPIDGGAHGAPIDAGAPRAPVSH